MVTILDCAIAAGAKPNEDGNFTAQAINDAGFPMFGGCSGCQASLAAYNMYPTRTGFVKCKDCVGDIGFATTDAFNAFLETEDEPVAIVGPPRTVNVTVDTEEMTLTLTAKGRLIDGATSILEDETVGITFVFGTIIDFQVQWHANTDKVRRLQHWFEGSVHGVYFIERPNNPFRIVFTGSGTGKHHFKLADGQDVRELKLPE